MYAKRCNKLIISAIYKIILRLVVKFLYNDVKVRKFCNISCGTYNLMFHRGFVVLCVGEARGCRIIWKALNGGDLPVSGDSYFTFRFASYEYRCWSACLSCRILARNADQVSRLSGFDNISARLGYHIGEK